MPRDNASMPPMPPGGTKQMRQMQSGAESPGPSKSKPQPAHDAASAPRQDISHEDQVRRRAYELYEERTRNNRSGDPDSDWLQAEHEARKQNPGR